MSRASVAGGVGVVLMASVAAGAAVPVDAEGVRAAEQAASVAGATHTFHSEHFSIVYTGERRFAALRAALLERLYERFYGTMDRLGIEVYRPRHKLVVVVLATQEQFERYLAGQGRRAPGGGAVLQGLYDPQVHRSVFFDQRRGGPLARLQAQLLLLEAQLASARGGQVVMALDGRPQVLSRAQAEGLVQAWREELAVLFERENEAVTLHEGAHHLIFASGLQNRRAVWPVWLSEGLACGFEDAGAHTRGAALMNRSRLERVRKALHQRRWLGLAELVTIAAPPAKDVESFYDQSWSLVAFLANRDAAALDDYLREIGQPADVDGRPYRAEEMAERAQSLRLFGAFFGSDLESLEREWQQWVLRAR